MPFASIADGSVELARIMAKELNTALLAPPEGVRVPDDARDLTLVLHLLNRVLHLRGSREEIIVPYDAATNRPNGLAEIRTVKDRSRLAPRDRRRTCKCRQCTQRLQDVKAYFERQREERKVGN